MAWIAVVAALEALVIAALAWRCRRRKPLPTSEVEQLIRTRTLESVARLAGGVAHDINNVLTVINGYGELLVDQLKEGDPLREDVGMICQAGERARCLTQQLVAFSRKQMIRPVPLNLNTVIAQSETALRELLKGIGLRIELAPDLGLVLADAAHLDQALLNLAANAREAMPEGGELVIRTENIELNGSGPAVLLTVADTGAGMSPEVQQHAFEPFYTTKAEGYGTGLGLAAVYGIVRQNGGSISFDSAPGKGTTFRLSFPLLPAAEVEPAPSPTAPAETPCTGTILVVEDQDDVRGLAVFTLRSKGYDVLEAAGGDQALSQARSFAGPIHVLLTDVAMPGMKGPELAARMKELRPDTQVIYTSGYTDDAAVKQGIAAGEVQYLSKPYSPTSLLTTVQRVLGQNG